MFCYKCGSQQQDGANFCHICGADLRHFALAKNDDVDLINKNVTRNSDYVQISELNENSNSIEVSNVNENIKSNLSDDDFGLSGQENIASESALAVDDIKNNKDCQKKISMMGTVAFALGVFEIFLVIALVFMNDIVKAFSLINGVNQTFFIYDILKFLACVLPFVNLIFSIVAIYKDKHIESVIASFFLNFSIFLFMIMYFGYSLFIRFF